MVEQIDAKLTPQARSSWRWRLFCIRAAIDQEIYRNSLGQGRDKVFRQACDELTKISHAENAWSVLRPAPIPAVNVEGPGLPSSYAEAIAASKPVAWWRMDKFHDRNIADATEHKNGAVFENGVTLLAPSNPATNADKKPNNRAACFSGGRIKATIEKLPDSYSVEFWFYNTMPNTARPVTAYIFSRGVEGPEHARRQSRHQRHQRRRYHQARSPVLLQRRRGQAGLGQDRVGSRDLASRRAGARWQEDRGLSQRQLRCGDFRRDGEGVSRWRNATLHRREKRQRRQPSRKDCGSIGVRSCSDARRSCWPL